MSALKETRPERFSGFSLYTTVALRFGTVITWPFMFSVTISEYIKARTGISDNKDIEMVYNLSHSYFRKVMWLLVVFVGILFVFSDVLAKLTGG